jgi:hypothetical protein
MNEDKNVIVRMMDWLVDTLAKTLVSLFDGVKNAMDHSNPSLFALVATLLPFALPLPVAFMTSHSAREFFGWDPWAANVLGFGLEGLGLLVWVKLVDAIIANIQSTNEKIENYVGFLWGVAIAYEMLLIVINVILALKDGADIIYALALLLVCLLPALSAAMYGLHKREVIHQLAREQIELKEWKERERQEAKAREERDHREAQELAERIRQERREDALRRAELKLKFASETPGVELEEKPNGNKFPKR